jgi:hypothetical protein
MDTGRRRSGAGALLACGVLAAGCTGGSAPAAGSAPPSPRPAPTSASTTAPLAATAVAAPAPGETVLGQLMSQHGTNLLGAYPVTTGAIAVYVVCTGHGEMRVFVEGVADFSQPCTTDAAAAGTRNVIDVDFVDSVTVQGQADNSQLWGITVTAVPAS